MSPEINPFVLQRVKRASVLLVFCALLAACGGGSDTGNQSNTDSGQVPTEPSKPTPDVEPQLKCAP